MRRRPLTIRQVNDARYDIAYPAVFHRFLVF